MRALCIGSAMVDIIVLVNSKDVERMTMTNATSSFLLLEQGLKIESQSISTHIGGGAVNTAVSMARLGMKAGVLVKVGEDQNGERILDRMTIEDVETSAVIRTEEAPTGTAVMVSSHDRNATIFTQRGANTLMRISDIDPGLMQNRDLVYIASLSGRSADCFVDIAAKADAAGAFVAANPGKRQLTLRTASILDSFPHLDLLAVNRVEAETLVPALAVSDDVTDGSDDDDEEENNSDEPRLMARGLHFGGFNLGLIDFMSRVRARGLANILITDGTQGAYLANADGVHHCPTLHTEVRGTAGAGDAFTSTLSALLASGEKVDAALRAAAVNAAAVVAAVDTQSGLLDRAQLDEKVSAVAAQLPVTSWNWPT
jgi:ribokinase